MLDRSSSVESVGACLAILSNLTIPDFDFKKLADSYSVLEFMSDLLRKACEGVERGMRASQTRSDLAISEVGESVMV